MGRKVQDAKLWLLCDSDTTSTCRDKAIVTKQAIIIDIASLVERGR